MNVRYADGDGCRITLTRVYGAEAPVVSASNFSYDPCYPITFSTIRGDVTFGNTGFMRIMRFDPATGLVNINIFSPGMVAAPAVAGKPDVTPDNCQPGGICATLAVGARTDLPSTYFPTITGDPLLDDGLHLRSASNPSYGFTVYVPGAS